MEAQGPKYAMQVKPAGGDWTTVRGDDSLRYLEGFAEARMVYGQHSDPLRIVRRDGWVARRYERVTDEPGGGRAEVTL